MSHKVLWKLVALLSALTATIVAIAWLKQGHMNSFWTSLGIQKQGTRLNWCEERVKSLHFYNTPLFLVEKGGKWMWDGEDPQALDYLRVEKWFAKNCLAPLDKDQPQSLDEAHPFVEVEFVDGTRMSIYQGEPGHFRIRDKVFASETLRQGLKELMAFGKKFGYE